MNAKELGGLSRRSFLKGAGVAAAAVASSAALAGCASGTGASQDWMPKSWDYECDLLVVGYGGAGMWASLIGADECGQQVLVLEKAPVRGGGNSSINNGEFAIINDAEGMRQYWHEMTQDVDTPSAVIDAWIDEGLRNCEYADKYELEYDINEKAIAGTIPEYSFLPGGEGCQSIADPPGFGMASFEILDQKRKDLGVEVLFDCHDEHLIQNPDTKEIVGCTTMIGSEEKTVKARKGVILCTGGFEFNEDMKRKYLKCYPFKFEGWKYNTGDGIRMTEEVGGKLWHMGMAGAMYGMRTRDPENDSLILIMPSDQTRSSTPTGWRAGWTRCASARRTTDGMRSPTSATRSAITTAPAGACSIRRCSNPASECPRARATGSNAELHHHAARRAARLGKAGRTTTRPRWTRAGSLKPTPEKGLRPRWKHRQWMTPTRSRGHRRHVEPGVRERRWPRNSTVRRHAEPAEQPAVLRVHGVPRLVLHAGRRAMKNEHGQVLDVFAEQPIPRLYGAGSFGNIRTPTASRAATWREYMIWAHFGRHAASLDAWDEKK